MSEHEALVTLPAREALERLQIGNKQYVETGQNSGNVSKFLRNVTLQNGQHPYAVILTCSDSRVIPEAIFQTGLGELFVIRVAGNVVDEHQIGSIEYAVEHLGVRLIIVMGHESCGAIQQALAGGAGGYIQTITDEIRLGIGAETDERRACFANIYYAAERIGQSIKRWEYPLKDEILIAGAYYHLDTGVVDFPD